MIACIDWLIVWQFAVKPDEEGAAVAESGSGSGSGTQGFDGELQYTVCIAVCNAYDMYNERVTFLRMYVHVFAFQS